DEARAGDGLETGAGSDQGDPRRRSFFETGLALRILGSGAILGRPVRLEVPLCVSLPDRPGTSANVTRPRPNRRGCGYEHLQRSAHRYLSQFLISASSTDPPPLQSSWMSKTYLKSDHFNGGGSVPTTPRYLVRRRCLMARRRFTTGLKEKFPPP